MTALSPDQVWDAFQWAVRILQQLDAHIDLGMEWQRGDLGIEDPTSFNERVLSEACGFLGQFDNATREQAHP